MAVEEGAFDADPAAAIDFTRDLIRWSESLAGIARTGLGFTESLYERERYEEVLKVAADIKAAADDALEPPHVGREIVVLFEVAVDAGLVLRDGRGQRVTRARRPHDPARPLAERQRRLG